MLNPKTKERELAYVVKIDKILPIEGAERVEQAVIGGWHIMVRKDQFKVGDYAIYFEIDSKVPQREPYMFLADKHFKIKTQKYFKGTVISQGLLMAFEDFEDESGRVPAVIASTTSYINSRRMAGKDPLEEPIFLTKELDVCYSVEEDNKRKANIDKYSRMYQRHIKLFKEYKILKWLYDRNWGKRLLFIFLGKKRDSRGWPSWVVKTDEERVQNMPWLFPDNPETWIVTEKIDGTSTTFTLRRGKKYGFYVCSRNVCFDKPEKVDRCYYDTNVYLEMAEKYKVEEVLQNMLDNHKDLEFVTLQGETYGKSVQNREYGLDGHDFMAFNLIFGYKNGNRERLNSMEMKTILNVYGIPSVPILDDNFKLPATCEEMVEYATGNSVVDGGMREGVVLRTKDGVQSFKAVSNEFLIKYHQ